MNSVENSKIIFDLAYNQSNLDIASKLSRKLSNKEGNIGSKTVDLRNVTQILKFTARLALLDDATHITKDHFRIYREDYI